MVGPVGPGGPILNPNEPPPPSFVPVDTITPSGATNVVLFQATANKPSLSAALKTIGQAKVEDIVEQFRGEEQRADLRKTTYAANAETFLTPAQRGEALIQAATLQLTISVMANSLLDPIEPTVLAENANVSVENLQTTLLNDAMNSWNDAKDAYDADPTPANLTALNNAETAYNSAKANYDSFRTTRNAQIDAYNALVLATQNALDAPDGVNDLKAELNSLVALLGLDPVVPAQYQLIRDHMPPSPTIPALSPPTPSMGNLPPRVTVDISAVEFDAAIVVFINQVGLAVQLLISESFLNRKFADLLADVYDLVSFYKKGREVNPATLETIVEKQPEFKAKENSSADPSSGVGSSAIMAAFTFQNVNSKESPGQAVFESESAVESITVPENFDEKARRILSDLNAIGSVRLQDIKLNGSIAARNELGGGPGVNNPALQTVVGANTINGIQDLVNSGDIDKTVERLINQSRGNGNAELGEATRIPLTAAIKVQYEFIAANELAESLGDPNIAALLLLATPGLEQLKTLLAGSSTVKAGDILTEPFSRVYLGVNLADRLESQGDLDQNQASAQANIILEELADQSLETLNELKQALLNALTRSFGGDLPSKIADGIIRQIEADRNVSSLNQPLVVDALRREAIIDQVTSDAAEKSALLSAFAVRFSTAQDIKDNAIAQLNRIGVEASRADALSDNLARVSLLDSAVTNQLNVRLKNLDPVVRKHVENEFLSTIAVPQKVKTEEREERINPLSIPNQIANQLAILRERERDDVISGIVDDAKRAAREDFGDFVERKRAQDLSRIYLHQTMDAGPFTDKSALPKSNFAKPASPIDSGIIAA